MDDSTSHDNDALLTDETSTSQRNQDIPSPPNAIWRAILAAGFDLDDSATMSWAGHDAIDIQVAYERIGKAMVALRSARKQLAKAAKIDPSRLRVAAKVVGRRLCVAVLGSSEDDASLATPEVAALAVAVAEGWHAAIAKRLSIVLGHETAPAHPADQQRDAAIDLMSVTMAKAITQGSQYTGSLRISIGAQVTGDVLSPLSVESLAQPCRQPKYTLSAPRTITAHVLSTRGPNTVILRTASAQKQWSATFRVRGTMGALLPLLCGCPPVMLEVREYTPDDAEFPPRHDCIIDAIVGTTSEWSDHHIAGLSTTINEIKQLHDLGPGKHRIT